MSETSVWPVILPLLATAVGVERVIEIIWNYLEWLLLTGSRWQPAQLKSAHYHQFKSGTSLILALVLGILIANATGMRFFEQLKVLVPTLLGGISGGWDVLLTGFIIGAATKPIHDLLGVITKLKEFLGYSAIHQREQSSAALAEGVLKLAQSEAQAMVEVPGIGPRACPRQG